MSIFDTQVFDTQVFDTGISSPVVYSKKLTISGRIGFVSKKEDRLFIDSAILIFGDIDVDVEHSLVFDGAIKVSGDGVSCGCENG